MEQETNGSIGVLATINSQTESTFKDIEAASVSSDSGVNSSSDHEILPSVSGQKIAIVTLTADECIPIVMQEQGTDARSTSKARTVRERRHKQTVRKTSGRSVQKEKEDEELVEQTSSNHSGNEIILSSLALIKQPIVETLGSTSKNKGGRPRKRLLNEPAATPQKKIIPIVSESLSPEDIVREEAKIFSEAVLKGLDITSNESTIEEETITANDVLFRALKVTEILQLTITRLSEENNNMKSTLTTIHENLKEYSRSTKLQLGNVQASVKALANDMMFFKNECIAEAKRTNEEYKEKFKEFETKYGYRVMERDILQEQVNNLEIKFNKSKLHIGELADEIARLERDIDETSKDNTEKLKYMKCQSCSANENLIVKLREELLKIRKEKSEWDGIKINLERQVENDKERLQTLGKELKKQTFLARTYEAMDKQRAARGAPQPAPIMPASHKPKTMSSTSKPNASKTVKLKDDKKSKPLPKPIDVIPSLSEIVDPEILAEAARMGNMIPPAFRVAQNRPTCSTQSNFTSRTESQEHKSIQNQSSPAQHRTISKEQYKQPVSRHEDNSSAVPCDNSSPTFRRPEQNQQPSSGSEQRRINWNVYLNQKRSQ